MKNEKENKNIDIVKHAKNEKVKVTFGDIMCEFLNCIVALLIVVCCFVGYQTAKEIRNNLSIRSENEKNAEEEKKESKKKKNKGITYKKTGVASVDEAMNRKYDFSKLKKNNPTICGWISIPAIGTDRVLMYGESEDYLNISSGGDITTEDNVFISSRSDILLNDGNTLIQGRNSGFNNLSDLTNESVRKANPYMYIYMENGSIRIYRIFASTEIDTAKKFYRDVPVPTVASITDYIKTLKKDCISFDDERKGTSHILTLMNYSKDNSLSDEEQITNVKVNDSNETTITETDSTASGSSDETNKTELQKEDNTPKGTAVFAEEISLSDVTAES